MKIVVIGTGYVGLVMGTGLAEFGHTVTCLDKNEKKIEMLNNSEIPIYEPGLKELVEKNVADERLFFKTSDYEAISNAEVVFIAVGTPTSRRGDGYADLTYVYAAAAEIAPYLKDYTVIVDKCTVPVGTARQVERIIRENNPDADFDVVSNPEFLREGAAVDDFLRPDRIVIGTESERAVEVMKQVYDPLYLLGCANVICNPESAELIKYAANAFLAVKISFINEMSLLCEACGADVSDLAVGIGLDGRIGKKFLHAGPGYGGSCFPKDTKALLKTSQEFSVPLRIVEAAVQANEAQRARMLGKIQNALNGEIAGKTIAVLGLSFKPETDDTRESPALSIIPRLVEMGAKVKAHDPAAMENAAKELENVEFVKNAYEAANNADALVLLTEWHQYRALDLKRLLQEMNEPVFIDLRNVYNPKLLKDMGFKYFSIGR
ncbi:MAG: UDP-glucose/GDP-mannose dehydrogenase family protein [Armatimonadota bacterium]